MSAETRSSATMPAVIPVRPEGLAALIDHTLLKPEATAAQVEALCREALEHGFHCVCVNPVHVRRARQLLDSVTTHVGASRRPVVGSVAGFPLGASRSETKADEADRAMDDGATEIDMVAHLGALVDGESARVRADILAVSNVVHRIPGGIVKVILEAGVLPTDRVVLGCRCAAEGEADFVKTSTGLHSCGGATVELVRLLHRHSAPMRVKAAGGIRTARDCLAMLEAGASRIGTSSGVPIMTEFRTALSE